MISPARTIQGEANTSLKAYLHRQNDNSPKFPVEQLMEPGPVGPFGVIVLSAAEVESRAGIELVMGPITEGCRVLQVILPMKTPLAIHPPALVITFHVTICLAEYIVSS